MNSTLSTAELAAMHAAIPVMTRKEKLLHFANIVRKNVPSSGWLISRGHFFLFDRLEHHDDLITDGWEHPHSAFTLAARDPVLREAGLANGTVGEARRFFELTKDELHAFSCNCGGELTNDVMANRIGALAHQR